MAGGENSGRSETERSPDLVSLITLAGQAAREKCDMQTSASNKAVVKKLIERVFIGHDLSVLDDVMRDDYIQHNDIAAQGKAGFIALFEQTFKAIPDFKYRINRLVAEDDFVVAYCTTIGTHNAGTWLDVAPKGGKLHFDVVDIFRVQDGKIAEHWDVADRLTLFSQLGVVNQVGPSK
jgi:predicted SnoaL-like aldol condensation-catalyzing enzyme